MDGAKELYHEEICEMAAQAETEALADFYAGPDDTDEAFRFFVDQEMRIADSYPHDLRWAQAVAHLLMYNRGIMSRTGAAQP